MAVETALDTVGIDGARVGDELARIGYQGAHPAPARRPTPTSSCTSSRAPSSRPRASRSARSPACRASRGRRSRSPASRTTPARPRCRCATTPGYAAAEVVTFVRRLAVELGGGRQPPGRHRRAAGAAARTSSTSSPPRPRSPSTSATPTRPCCRRPSAASQGFLEELAEREGVVITTRGLARFEPVAFDERVVGLVERTAERSGCRRCAHASRRGPRRPDARPAVPDGHDLRAEPRRHQPQPGRAHRPRRPRRRAPTSCSTCSWPWPTGRGPTEVRP